jgi:hypothetical protein
LLFIYYLFVDPEDLNVEFNELPALSCCTIIVF